MLFQGNSAVAGRPARQSAAEHLPNRRMPSIPYVNAKDAHSFGHGDCCGAPPEAAGSRRKALGLFAALLLAPQPEAQATDDLLDPSLLQRKGGNDAPAPTRPNSSTAQGPGEGRTMSESVVNSLDGLTSAAASRVAEVDRLDKLSRDLQEKLSRARAAMEEAMADYRAGLFCSGCGKTKTEILRVGDTFPHPGQQIIRATQPQINSKEREMQNPIDTALRDLKDAQDRRRKAAAERDEAMVQIDAGLALWNTSMAFERQAIDLQRQQAERAYSADRAAMDKALFQVSGSTPAVEKRRDQIRNARLELEKRRRARHVEFDGWDARATSSASDQQARLDNFLGRPPLQKMLSAMATIVTYVPVGSSFNDLGGMYRMGDFSIARRDETLPPVESFIKDFRKLPAWPATQYKSQNATPPHKLREMLKDLLTCEPADADCQRAPKLHNGGSGVRG